MKTSSGHVVAIFGGATAGSEAASIFANRGIKVVVFDQNEKPYGKIEDGLPRWHDKLQNKEKAKIDKKLLNENIFFVPKTKLGKDIELADVVNNWGFSAVLLANGAWKDRSFNFIEKSNNEIIFQNSFVYWFNHKHEENYSGKTYKAQDNAIVIGGGLASLDVAKIIMFETVTEALAKLGIKTDALELDHKSIPKVLDEHGLTFDELGLKGCAVYYRRRIKDMPLAQIPVNADDAAKEKIYNSRTKILENYRRKYLFNVVENHSPSETIETNGRVTGLKFKQTEMVEGKLITKDDNLIEVNSSQIVLSIGSIPEPINGIEMKGELYNMEDYDSGKVKNYDNVFALGNVVTGKGNIRASAIHGKEVSNHVMENFLSWREEDYEELLSKSEVNAAKKVEGISEYLKSKNIPDEKTIETILNNVDALQNKVGYDGNYNEWISKHS